MTSKPPHLNPLTRWLFALLALAIITVTAILVLRPPSDRLQLIFCDVGQGDAAIVQLHQVQMIIDVGPGDQILACLDRHLPLGDRQLEFVTISHPQADHAQGLIAILDHYQVDHIALPPVGNSADFFQTILNQLSHYPQNRITNLYSNDQLKFSSDLHIKILWPDQQWTTANLSTSPHLSSSSPILGVSTTRDLNDFSLVLHLQYQDFDALFTGDAGQDIQEQILSSHLTPSHIEVLKVPHHGSRTGLLTDFLNQLSPDLSIISVGKNSYGHPSYQIIQRLRDSGSRVLRTDQVGDITISSDGHHWWVGE